jgi:hypothetical protein
MTQKYATGNYTLIFFDRYGTKINTVIVNEDGLLKAQDAGHKAIADGLCASFVVSRVLYNSLDATDP